MIIDAHRSDRETWRIQRVEKAVNLFCEIHGITREQLSKLVYLVNDHKGFLQVTWEDGCFPPSLEQKWSFGKAWRLCGEPAVNVDHFDVNAPI